MKMPRMSKQLELSLSLLVGLLGLGFVYPAEARAKSIGTTTADILKVNLGPRPAALGGAFVAYADDHNSVFFNPAGLQKVSFDTFSFSHFDSLTDISYETFIYAKKQTSRMSIALFTTFRHQPPIHNGPFPTDPSADFDSCNFPGNAGLSYCQPFKTSDLVVGIGLGTSIGRTNAKGRQIRVGGNVKFIQSTLGSISAKSFALDLGAQIEKVFKNLNVGLVIQNLGTPMKFVEVSDPLPLFLRLGFAYPVRLGSTEWAFLMDLAKPLDSTIKVDLGLEIWLFERRIAARLGYSLEAAVTVDFDSEGLPIASTAKFAINPGVRNLYSNVSLGFGFEHEKRHAKYIIDFSYNPARFATTIEGTFLLGLTIQFKKFRLF